MAITKYRRILATPHLDARECAICRTNVGLALQQMGQSDAALEEFKAASSADPTYTKAYYRRIQLLRELHRHAEALALERPPPHPEILALLEQIQDEFATGAELAAATATELPVCAILRLQSRFFDTLESSAAKPEAAQSFENYLRWLTSGHWAALRQQSQEDIGQEAPPKPEALSVSKVTSASPSGCIEDWRTVRQGTAICLLEEEARLALYRRLLASLHRLALLPPSRVSTEVLAIFWASFGPAVLDQYSHDPQHLLAEERRLLSWMSLDARVAPVLEGLYRSPSLFVLGSDSFACASKLLERAKQEPRTDYFAAERWGAALARLGRRVAEQTSFESAELGLRLFEAHLRACYPKLASEQQQRLAHEIHKEKGLAFSLLYGFLMEDDRAKVGVFLESIAGRLWSLPCLCLLRSVSAALSPEQASLLCEQLAEEAEMALALAKPKPTSTPLQKEPRSPPLAGLAEVES